MGGYYLNKCIHQTLFLFIFWKIGKASLVLLIGGCSRVKNTAHVRSRGQYTASCGNILRVLFARIMCRADWLVVTATDVTLRYSIMLLVSVHYTAQCSCPYVSVTSVTVYRVYCNNRQSVDALIKSLTNLSNAPVR